MCAKRRPREGGGKQHPGPTLLGHQGAYGYTGTMYQTGLSHCKRFLDGEATKNEVNIGAPGSFRGGGGTGTSKLL